MSTKKFNTIKKKYALRAPDLHAKAMPNRLARSLHCLENQVISGICSDGTHLAWGAERLWAERRQTYPHRFRGGFCGGREVGPFGPGRLSDFVSDFFGKEFFYYGAPIAFVPLSGNWAPAKSVGVSITHVDIK